MAKTNYSYEKRARELEKQKKKEEKRLKKSGGKDPDAENTEVTPAPVQDDSAQA